MTFHIDPTHTTEDQDRTNATRAAHTIRERLPHATHIHVSDTFEHELFDAHGTPIDHTADQDLVDVLRDRLTPGNSVYLAYEEQTLVDGPPTVSVDALAGA